MQSMIPGAAAIALTALTSLVVPAPSYARDYPWCANIRIHEGEILSCIYDTHAQCMETVMGLGGYCKENPRYLAPPPPRRSKPRRS